MMKAQNCRLPFLPKFRLLLGPSGRLRLGKNNALSLLCLRHVAPRFAKPRDVAQRCNEVQHDVGTKLQSTVFIEMQVAARNHSSSCLRFG